MSNNKKKIKKRINPKSNKKYIEQKVNKMKIKPRQQEKEKEFKYNKEDIRVRNICIVACLIIIAIFYFFMGILFASIVAFGFAFIAFVAWLLHKCEHNRKLATFIRVIIILCLTVGILGITAFGAFLLYIKKDADPKYDIKKLQTQENTSFLDMKGVEYAKLGSEMRDKIEYKDIPEVLIDAIIATEDSRFFQHNGFDAPRFLKASIGQVLGHSDAGGASTLTMQVVKNQLTNAFLSSGWKGVVRKFDDIYLAVFKVEKDCTKEQIIEYYVNNHYLGVNYYGVQQAANAYFGKDVNQLTLAEATVIAGIFQSPNSYNPVEFPENAEKRRKTVLYLMRLHGYITEEEEEMANSIPVKDLIGKSKTASYDDRYNGYIDTVVAEIKRKYDVNPYTTPLIVYTNLERDKQDAVNDVMNGETYDWINNRVQAGVAVIEAETGKIRAIGNGRAINGRTTYGKDQYNYATDLNRQCGSTAKPLFDYGPGFEYNNWSTYNIFDDSPYKYSSGQSIKNWDNGYFGKITLRRALSTSRNIPALKAFQAVNNQRIIEFVMNLGITPELSDSTIPESVQKSGQKAINKYIIEHSIKLVNGTYRVTSNNVKIHEAHAIGAFTGTNPLQMAAAYAAFANGGYYNEPYSVDKIIFKNTGEEKVHSKDNYVVGRKAMSASTAFMIADVLQDVSLSGGVGRIKNVASKTGTTNYDDATMRNNKLPSDAIRDSWTISFSTKTVIGLWYGYDFIDSKYCLHNIPGTVQKDKIINALIKNGAMESDRSSFKKPNDVVKVGIVPDTNPAKLPGANYSGKLVYEYFKKGYEPDEVYTDMSLIEPKNLMATYDENTKQVNITWDAIDISGIDDEEYGNFKYNVYFNSTLIGTTANNNYTYKPTSTPYGTYKVIGAYEYGDIKSGAATYQLKEVIVVPDNLTLEYNGDNAIPESGSLEVDLNKIIVKNNGSPVSAAINSCTPTTITTIGDNTITCNVTYNEKTQDLSLTISTVKKEETPPEEPVNPEPENE